VRNPIGHEIAPPEEHQREDECRRRHNQELRAAPVTQVRGRECNDRDRGCEPQAAGDFGDARDRIAAIQDLFDDGAASSC
jgi:hypothetical protein